MKKTNSDAKKIQVAIRMRPLLKQFEIPEIAWNINEELNTITSLPRTTHRIHTQALQATNLYEFTANKVYSQSRSNSQVYEQSSKKIILKIVENEKTNGTIFMYGQTTSGKTYTMLGDDQQLGIIIYSLMEIFQQVQKYNQKIFSTELSLSDLTLSEIKGDLQQNVFSARQEDLLIAKNKKLTISISYFQIYNQQITDLLNPEKGNLKIIDNDIPQLSHHYANSYQQALKLLALGQQHRAYNSKAYHDHSSRSHTIFQIKLIEGESKKHSMKLNKGIKIRNILNLVDLAGSQRLSDDPSNQQTNFINKSLFALSNVIGKLALNKKSVHIPFRDSKLTRLLQPSLTGKSQTLIVCTISPAACNFNQTLSTLRFANNSKKIQFKNIEQNQILNQSPIQRKKEPVVKRGIQKNKRSQLDSMKVDSTEVSCSISNQEFLQQKNTIQMLQNENKFLRANLAIMKQNSKLTQNKQNYFQKINKRADHNCQYQQKVFLQDLAQKILKYIQHDMGNKEINKTNIRNCEDKINTLCDQYKKNVGVLKQEYSKALLNIFSTQLKIEKNIIVGKIKPQLNRINMNENIALQ